MRKDRELKKNETYGDIYVDIVKYENGVRSVENVNILELDLEGHEKFLRHVMTLKSLYELIMGKEILK